MASPIVLDEDQLSHICACKQFVRLLVKGSPHSSLDALLAETERLWWHETGAPGWLEDMASCEPIGVKQFHDSVAGRLSQQEQAAALASSSADLAEQLRQLNEAYYQRFGHIYVICARGKSAAEIVDNMRARLGNATLEELRVAAGERLAIVQLRLRALVAAAQAQSTPDAGFCQRPAAAVAVTAADGAVS